MNIMDMVSRPVLKEEFDESSSKQDEMGNKMID